MLFSLKFALLALASVAAAQSSSTGAEASGSSSSSTAVVTASSSTSSSASSTSATSSGNATSSGAVPLPSGSPANLTPCIVNCVMKAAEENGCGSFTNLTCVCTFKPFQTAATSCLMANCTSTDVDAANSLQMSQCAAIVGSSGASGMPPNTLSSTASGSGSRTPISPASTGASSTAPAASTTNGAQLSAASGVWALVAGLMGITAAAL